jgi:hypothetical protein
MFVLVLGLPHLLTRAVLGPTGAWDVFLSRSASLACAGSCPVDDTLF